ncbi:MAG TPA: hypothetical protein VM324_16140 [Egibacteraceae bacterium]|jgi:hypothetical protein|nr:hypothetical protein [Egibacteraceae bacterium]
MRVALLVAVTAFVLAACGEGADPFAGLPPRAVPDSIPALASAQGWEVTGSGVLAHGGGTFTLAVPDEDVPGPGEGPTEIVFHLDRVEADGTTLQTLDMAAVTVTAGGAPAETMTLPDEAGAHYALFAEVGRADGTFDRYDDWLYVP